MVRVRTIGQLEFAADIPTAKCPRERLLWLQVRALHCPLVFERVLGLVTGAAIIPVDVALETDDRTFVIEIQFDRAQFMPTHWILKQVEGVPSVRSAEFLDASRRQLLLESDGHRSKRAAAAFRR